MKVKKKERCVPLLGVRSDYLDHSHSQMTKLVEKREAFYVDSFGCNSFSALQLFFECFLF